MDKKWVVSSSPHLLSPESTSNIMWQVVAALAPAGVWAVYQWGWSVVWVCGLSVGTAVLVEAVCQRMRGLRITVHDGSAVVTGLLLAYVLPSGYVAEQNGVVTAHWLPWYVPVVGAAFAIAIVKQAFGGLGYNIWNPALGARAFVQVAWPEYISMTKWVLPRSAPAFGVDAVSAATPLHVKTGAYTVSQLFFGQAPGSLGEVSALLLLAGGVYLIARGYVDWRLPLAYLATAALLALILPPRNPATWSHDPLYQLFAGGIIIGAFFMATDMVTSPLTHWGQVIFGVGCGLLTLLIRSYTGYPEGVCYSILLMNTARPLIDRYTRPRVFGRRKEATA